MALAVVLLFVLVPPKKTKGVIELDLGDGIATIVHHEATPQEACRTMLVYMNDKEFYMNVNI